MLLPPIRLQHLTWDELDSLQVGQDIHRQKQMEGFRLIATQVHNLLAEKALKPHEYLTLPAIDGAQAEPRKPNSDWLRRMKEKHGDKLEL